MTRQGKPNFTAYSAGRHPSGTVRPEAIHQIEKAGLSTSNFWSKSWNEFSVPGAPPLHFVFTACASAANEVCPLWPGQPMMAHWGVPDPAAVQGRAAGIERAFASAFAVLDRRTSFFLCLPLASLETFSLQREIDDIGEQ